MSVPRHVSSLLEAWTRGASLMTFDECESVGQLLAGIEHVLARARAMPASLDGRARDLVVTKLEEAGHWTTAMVAAACARPDPEGGEP